MVQLSWENIKFNSKRRVFHENLLFLDDQKIIDSGKERRSVWRGGNWQITLEGISAKGEKREVPTNKGLFSTS